jgi:hypothetical protein
VCEREHVNYLKEVKVSEALEVAGSTEDRLGPLGRRMMMSSICSCRNKNELKAIYPKGTSHHTRLFRGPSTNDMKK